MLKKIFICIVFLGLIIVNGCGNVSNTTSAGTSSDSVVGTWRNLSTPSSTTRLILDSSGTWAFDTSSGTLTISSIEASDWTSWGINAYDGPTRKLILTGWNKTESSGPIEESGGTINYIWLVYLYTDPDTKVTSTVQVKYGRI